MSRCTSCHSSASSGDRMPFGKYKDQPIENVPQSYLDWLLDQDTLFDLTREMLEREVARREEDSEVARAQRYRDIREEVLREVRGSTEAPPHVGRLPAMTREEQAMGKELVRAGVRALARTHHPDHGGRVAVMQAINLVAERLRRWLDHSL